MIYLCFVVGGGTIADDIVDKRCDTIGDAARDFHSRAQITLDVLS